MRRHPDTGSITKGIIGRALSGGLGVLLLALVMSGLLFAAPAAANYELVKTFEDPAGQAIRARTGLAVNVNGAGGVSPGSLYEVGRAEAGGVNRYNAKGEFQGHWGGFPSFGVAVGQSTGCVYVLIPGHEHVVSVFNADGSQEVTSFGEKGGANETIAEGPEKLHRSEAPAGIAVDAAGKVYVADEAKFFGENRIMVFEPEAPGSCKGYAYAGQGSDIAVGLVPNHPVVDPAGNLYAVTGGEKGIAEFAAGEPDTPICEFELATGGIVGMTVNTNSGEVFYFSEKDKEKKIHALDPCSEGKFKEDKSKAIAVQPKPEEAIDALAFNPSLVWEPSRPPGVLYGASWSFFKAEPNYVFAGPVSHEPEVESESVSNVTATTATLKAQINPKGATTSYAFQYLTEAAYEANEPADRFAGASEAPIGGAVLGAGQDPLPAAAAIAGLAPDTAYRYRVLATSAEGADEGDAQIFHTFPLQAPGLPDERAYELVSSVKKNGGEVFPANPLVSSCGVAVECKPGTLAPRSPLQSTPDGDGVVYQGSPFSLAEGAPIVNGYLSRRTASGWQTTNPTPPLYGGVGGAGYQAFDAALTAGLFYENGGAVFSPEAPPGYPDLYRQPTGDPTALSALLSEPPPNRPEETGYGNGGLHLEYAAATADLSHVLVAANDALTEATPFAPASEDGGPEKDNLYEWVGGGLHLVNVLPGNAATVPGAAFGSGFKLSKETSGNEETPGADDRFFGLDFSHAISDDGSRVFWSSESGQVYVRIDGEETLEVQDHAGKFLTASADGSRVLLGDGCLYDLEAESCEDLTNGQGGFKGILGQSEDLSSIYFLDTAALTPESEENANGEHAEANGKNLYSWQEGDLAFIATLDPKDRTDWTVAPIKRTAEASPNGRWVAFLSQAALTGVDNTGPCGLNGVKIVPGPCPEAFLFDSASGALICASCNPSGALPLGRTFLPRISVGGVSSLPQPRYLTDQGRLYFDSRDSLTPFDTNNGVEDVYQYEPQGIGTCKRGAGCISLISAGHEPVDSNFLAIDKTGKNVFFTSRDQLVLPDRDELIDLYDAREKGGIAAETETAKSECQGEACQPAAVVPNDQTPGSSSFQGAGNVAQGGPKPRCAKGKSRRHGRCVKRSKPRHERSHKRANRHRGGAR
jgi:DNA-binding beta-propeller fold protein YncE